MTLAGPPERLLVFARAPVPGRVKTRLVPALGEAGACAFHRACVLDVVERHRRHAPAGRWVEVVRADAPHDPFWAVVGGAQSDQRGADLGARMATALDDALRQSPRVVLIGTDSPTLPPERVDAAFEALRRVDVVLGPALDGGYYLIGARGRVPPCFTGPVWGGDRVLADTIDLLCAAGLRYERLEPCFDVDHPSDLDVLRQTLADLRRAGAGLPVRVARLLDTGGEGKVAPRGGAPGAEETP